MKSLNHVCAIGRYFLLMMAIPTMTYAADQTKKSEPQSLICTPEKASLISDKNSDIIQREFPEERADRFLFTKFFNNQWKVIFYPFSFPVFSNCTVDDKQAFCYSDSRRLPSTGEFTYHKKDNSTIVFTAFVTFIDPKKDGSESIMTMGYCRPFKN